MVSANHFASEEIQNKLTHMEEKWQQLMNTSTMKRDMLKDAYQVGFKNN